MQPSNLRIYDAVLEPNKTEDEVDPEMEKFQSLLKDYLNGMFFKWCCFAMVG